MVFYDDFFPISLYTNKEYYCLGIYHNKSNQTKYFVKDDNFFVNSIASRKICNIIVYHYNTIEKKIVLCISKYIPQKSHLDKNKIFCVLLKLACLTIQNIHKTFPCWITYLVTKLIILFLFNTYTNYSILNRIHQFFYILMIDFSTKRVP